MFCRLSDIRLLLSEVIPLRIFVNKLPATALCACCRHREYVRMCEKRQNGQKYSQNLKKNHGKSPG
jgi:hypothetical protein